MLTDCEHQTSYRQTNLCPQWYANDRCTFGEKCEDSHRLEGVPNEHRYIRTETDAMYLNYFDSFEILLDIILNLLFVIDRNFTRMFWLL